MLATLFVPPASDLTLESVTVTPTAVLLQLTSTAPTARCPLCQQPASRVHSHYTRTLHDLPAAGRPVQLRVRVRRFFCRTPQCPRWIFAERIPCRVRKMYTEAERAAQNPHPWLKTARHSSCKR
jgi:transposase